MADDTVPINLRIPLDAHPATLGSGDGALAHALTQTYRTWSGVVDAEARLDEKAKGARPSPPGKRMSETERAVFQQRIDEWTRRTSVYKSDLARDATPKIEGALASLDRALATARNRADALATEIDKTLAPRPADTPYDIEIRERLRGGDIAALTNAVKSDPRVCAAVLGAPPLLLGVDRETHDLLKATAVARYCPEKQASLDALTADIDRVQRARDSFFERMTESIRSWQSEDQQIIKEALA